MSYLFGPKGLRELRKFCRKEALFAFDFDGTLAPLASVPEKARMLPTTIRLWKELRKITLVAVITGRSRKDAATKFKDSPHFLIGNHGLESDSRSSTEKKKAKRIVSEWQPELKKGLISIAGAEIENKVFSVSIHYRGSPDLSRAKTLIGKVGAGLRPKPRLIPGKFVVNLVPAGSPNKGTSLVALLKRSRLKRALFVGDDYTDEDVFRLKRRGLFTISVGKRRGAQYYIKSQSEIDRLLFLLVTLCGEVSSK